MSQKFALDWFDAYKGLQMFVVTAVLTSVGGVVLSSGFDVFTADWVSIFKNAVNISVISTFSYIIKNLLTNSSGDFLGKGL